MPLQSLCAFYDLSKSILLLNSLYVVIIATVFHFGFARERIKIHVLISSVSAGIVTPCRWQHVRAPRIVVVWVVMGMCEYVHSITGLCTLQTI
jgi:hypothetical protein